MKKNPKELDELIQKVMDRMRERRYRKLLILGYDAAMRVGEVTCLKVCDLHLDAEVPYIRILGKGGK